MKHPISKQEILKQIEKYKDLDMVTLLASLLIMVVLAIVISNNQASSLEVQTFTTILIFFAILNLSSVKEKLYYQNKYNILYVYNNPHVRTKMKELNSK